MVMIIRKWPYTTSENFSRLAITQLHCQMIILKHALML